MCARLTLNIGLKDNIPYNFIFIPCLWRLSVDFAVQYMFFFRLWVFLDCTLTEKQNRDDFNNNCVFFFVFSSIYFAFWLTVNIFMRNSFQTRSTWNPTQNSKLFDDHRLFFQCQSKTYEILLTTHFYIYITHKNIHLTIKTW